jgi:alpha-beta hydrolase superfamily lysophospholipase
MVAKSSSMNPDPQAITTEEIMFSSDGLCLRGTLHRPSCDLPPVVIGSHGLLSSRRSPKQIALANRCCRYGMAFFRFDHRGVGDSQGPFA